MNIVSLSQRSSGGQADSSLSKASIINLDKGGEVTQCLFNPNQYQFSKQNVWTREQTAGTNVPQLEFGGGEPATLQMDLLFDTYTENTSGRSFADVRRKYTDGLWKLMMVDEDLRDAKNQKGRPPKVRFQWGRTWTFDAVILSMTQKFTLFAPDGTPVRATVNVTFQQVKDEKQLAPQNPTSAGEGGERTWVVCEGDTLAWISHKSYGNPTKWRLIADANQLSQVRDLKPGTRLLLPNG
jgi:nucleoid-associated protein YgaU